MKSDFKKVTKKAIETGKSAFDEATEQISDAIEVAANHGKSAFDQVPILTEEIISGGKKVAGETADHVSDAILKTKSQVAAYAKKNPQEIKYMAAGGAGGLGAGLWIGGAIGVVGFFGAVGIPIAVLGGIGGAIVGNRLGLQFDKKKLEELNREQSERLFQLLLERNRKNIERIKTNEEHRKQLFKAMAQAEECLVILSGWATNYVVDNDFQNRLAACLKRGVNVYIGYGYQTARGPKRKRKEEDEAEKNLSALMAWSEKQNTDGLIIVRYYPNHAKLLICDDKWLVAGSFNWLSNVGRSKNEEYSCVIKDKKFVSTELDITIDGLMSPMKATRRDLLRPFTEIFKDGSDDKDDDP